MKQRIALLGSTGSIGVQTLDIVRENSELFEITTLTAHRNWEALARQAEEFAPDSVVIADDSKYDALRRALADRPVKVYAGADAIRQVVQADTVDTVVNALVGYAGLLPTVAAIEAGKKVALANKETLVVGGDYIMRLAAERRVPILPIDSEHSAIFQCLVGEASPARRPDRHLFGRCTARRTARAARRSDCRTGPCDTRSGAWEPRSRSIRRRSSTRDSK